MNRRNFLSLLSASPLIAEATAALTNEPAGALAAPHENQGMGVRRTPLYAVVTATTEPPVKSPISLDALARAYGDTF